MLAIWALAVAILILAAAIVGAMLSVAVDFFDRPRGLTDEEIIERLAPVVAAELIVHQAADREAE